jgi:hypothetical protein
MKAYLRIQVITAFALVLLMFNACTERFEDLNTKNSLVEEASVDLILTYVQYSAFVADASNGGSDLGNYAGMSVSISNRPFQEVQAPGIWNNCYQNYVRNLSDIIYRTKDDPELVNKTAIARILRVWAFSNCTDTYGDIPYFEVALPQEDAIYRPKYDSQKSIYEDFFKELKEAAQQLDAGKESYGSADLVYGGDVAKWEKFANSLRLRLALRVRYVDAAMAQANMSDLDESDLITTREDDAYVNTSNDYPEHQNQLYADVLSIGQSVIKRFCTKTMIDLWQNNFDPRLKVFADTAMANWPGTPGYEDVENFGYRGYPLLGLVPIEYKYPWQYESCSRWSTFFYVPVIEKPVLKSSEIYFALAEAALFGLKGSSADAQEYYKKGMEAALDWSVEFYGSSAAQLPDVLSLFRPDWTDAEIQSYLNFTKITQEEVDAFIDTASVVTLAGNQEEMLEMIINQKIASFYPMQEFQGWTEWRRTGYPRVLVGPDDDDLHGVSPRRMPYPTSETQLNEANYDAAVLSSLGGSGNDKRLSKVWWDVNPDAPHAHPDGTTISMDGPWVVAGE